MTVELGLRERKKLRTRHLIAETARRMFAERGFEDVPVAEIARAAEVSEATVFNYFPTKEDLVFQGMEAFETELLAVVRERPAGESYVAAFARFVLRARGLLAAEDEHTASFLTKVTRMIATSPALLTREREILARYTESLAALIAEDAGAAPGDLRPWVTAHALIGTHHTLIQFVRRQLLAGNADHAGIAQELQLRGRQALDLLSQGLGGYGAGPAGSGDEAGTAGDGAARPAGEARSRGGRASSSGD